MVLCVATSKKHSSDTIIDALSKSGDLLLNMSLVAVCITVNLIGFGVKN